MRTRRTGSVLASVAMLVLGGARAQALSDADKCEAAKNKVAGKYAFCRQKAEAKAVKTGNPVDYSKCDGKLSQKWADAETGGGGMCPTSGDLGSVQLFLTDQSDEIAASLDGAGPLVGFKRAYALCQEAPPLCDPVYGGLSACCGPAQPNADATPSCGPCRVAAIGGPPGAGCGIGGGGLCIVGTCNGGGRDGKHCDLLGSYTCPGGFCDGVGSPVVLTGDETGCYVGGYFPAGTAFDLCP